MPAQRAYTVVSTCCLYCTVELYLLYLYSTYYSPGGTTAETRLCFVSFVCSLRSYPCTRHTTRPHTRRTDGRDDDAARCWAGWQVARAALKAASARRQWPIAYTRRC